MALLPVLSVQTVRMRIVSVSAAELAAETRKAPLKITRSNVLQGIANASWPSVFSPRKKCKESHTGLALPLVLPVNGGPASSSGVLSEPESFEIAVECVCWMAASHHCGDALCLLCRIQHITGSICSAVRLTVKPVPHKLCARNVPFNS